MAAPSPFRDLPPIATTVPTLAGLPLLGSLLAFRRDRLALHDEAARVGPIVRFNLGGLPLYTVTCADLAHEILVEQAAAFKKTAGLRFLAPVLGDGLLSAVGARPAGSARADARQGRNRARFAGDGSSHASTVPNRR